MQSAGTPEPPIPPFELADRVGHLDENSPEAHYRWLGDLVKGEIVSRLPEDWSWEGKRVLDFGCGAGRVVRRFLPETDVAEFYACDIDAPSVEWVREHLSPPITVSQNGALPPLDFPDGHFDLIYATSVFTHLVESWSRWLLELHRLLVSGGVLVVDVLGPYMLGELTGEGWDDAKLGMNVVQPARSWDSGGPSVIHSEWWLRGHWGRAFDFERYDALGGGSHTWLSLRKRDVSVTAEDLERPIPDEPRELSAAQHNVLQLSQEIAEHVATEERLRGWNAELKRSPSWRLTAPLRAVKRIATRGSGEG